MNFEEKLNAILERYEGLATTLSRSDIAQDPLYRDYLKEYKNLQELVGGIQRLHGFQKQLGDIHGMPLEEDPLLKAMVLEEIHLLEKAIEDTLEEVRFLLLPKDEDDSRNAILEIRAGTGGAEAALFVADLMRMYKRYAEGKGWQIELLQLHESDQGGIKEVGLSLMGKDVFSRLKFEAGVHRVQRVPSTEANGRVHTSAATVAVLPEAEEIDVQVEEKDLRIDVFRSSGPGGQSVNTTDSAVRITHLPTGIVVQQQDEKSQHKNKAKALKVLRSRIYEAKKALAEAERSSSRKEQIGRGDRWERIRTYNYPQGRFTDHRIKLTLHKLHGILEGEGLDEVIDALISEDRTQKLLEASVY